MKRDRIGTSEVDDMGYVPPTSNETAVQYGSRDVKSGSSIRKIQPTAPVQWYGIHRYQRDPFLNRQEVYELLHDKRKKVEKELEGKGKKLDTLA